MPLSHDWKPINGFEGYYVSKSGDVFSRKRNVVLKHSIHRGYHAVKLYANGKGKSKFVHRLVAEAFIENPNMFPEVNHKDENTSNNAADNLEWCTSKYNANYGTLPERQRKRMLANNPFKGMHHTKETKAKMRAAKLGKPSLRKREVCIDGVIYESVADAMRKLNVCTRKLYKLLEVN